MEPLLNASSQVEYSMGHLLFVRGNTLEAQLFDASRLRLAGEAFPVAEGIGNNPANGRAALGASPNGTLIYRGNNGMADLAWLDRSGKHLAAPGEFTQAITHFSLSADEKHAALAINGDLWVVDLARGTTSRLTFGSLVGDGSAWSPDGSHVYFAGNLGGVQGLYQKASDGSGNEELVLKKGGAFPVDVSRDGKLLLYQQTEAQTGADLWIALRPLVYSEGTDREWLPLMRLLRNKVAHLGQPVFREVGLPHLIEERAYVFVPRQWPYIWERYIN
jgi:eukaryotic-like serine/threonine-protein kinase